MDPMIDDNTVKVLTLIFTAITTLGLAVLSYLTLKANLASQQAAKIANTSAVAQEINANQVRTVLAKSTADAKEATKEVKETLELATKNTDTKLNAIHTLVNSSHGIALLATVTALEEVVELTHDPKRKILVMDRLALARKEYADHQAKQAVVDKTNG